MSLISRQFLTLELLHAREAAMQFFRPSLNKHGLTEQQWRILRMLKQHGDLESHHLANLVCILKPSMTGVLKRMARDNLILKQKAEHDQRRIFVRITELGIAVYHAMKPEVEESYQRLLSQFDAEKTQQLVQLLGELKKVKP